MSQQQALTDSHPLRERLRAAWVIARRDFTAIIFSRAFLFFLLGPIFPILVGVGAGGLSKEVSSDMDRPIVGVMLTEAETQSLMAANTRLADAMGGMKTEMVAVNNPDPADPAAYLASGKQGLAAVISGSLDAPVLTGTSGIVGSFEGRLSLLAGEAKSGNALILPKVTTSTVDKSAGKQKQNRLMTAQAGQMILFLLTMLLAGMVLSNLVEEKANKIIEILAAAIPVDAIFLGKLFAMLAMSMVGISVWMGLAGLAFAFGGSALPVLTAPAVGWPMFLLLGFLYFSTAYLLLGSLFLGIGAMARTVREVQTLSMPVTMIQLVVFFLASYAVTKIGEPVEVAAAIFPLSSPFAMLARAAQQPDLGQHALALAWQAVFVGLIVWIGAQLFRRNVMKSGRAKGKGKGLFSRGAKA